VRPGSYLADCLHRAADVDEIVGNDPETDPVHADEAFVAAAVEPVMPLSDTDATFAAGPPFLAVAEPSLPLFAFAFEALGGAVGNADALDPHGLGGRLFYA
jgi:hypothetical protein